MHFLTRSYIKNELFFYSLPFKVRIDFVDTSMLSPSNGVCEDQYLTVRGSFWKVGVNRLCGINPDQHFYLHLDKSMSFEHVDFSLTTLVAG